MQRHALRTAQLENGWAVWDREANAPARFGGLWQAELDMDVADELTDLLNAMAKENPAG